MYYKFLNSFFYDIIFLTSSLDSSCNPASTAFLCQITGDTSSMESGTDSAGVELIPKNRIKTLDLAFDHREIIEEANILN